ncbi:hypothetical protein QTO34_014209 [Cnephaeus nilssonii]|uniref:UBC core domain-containing protein n=1 Tax=Cnephaeus nilssonii TaxID=3371016 RepID=A0AA40I6S1_CNENI|nr:hypothetical protein QTO34_014209 [Eptesicus nilssonii]
MAKQALLDAACGPACLLTGRRSYGQAGPAVCCQATRPPSPPRANDGPRSLWAWLGAAALTSWGGLVSPNCSPLLAILWWPSCVHMGAAIFDHMGQGGREGKGSARQVAVPERVEPTGRWPFSPPPQHLLRGWLLRSRLKFPIDYSYTPPAFRFLTKMWHPNIYETGGVCISILHPPVDDVQSSELPSERWNPTHNVRTIPSVISLLKEPNTFSWANVDASVMHRKWKESKDKHREYTDNIRKQVLGKVTRRPAFGGTVPIFNNLPRVPLRFKKVPIFGKNARQARERRENGKGIYGFRRLCPAPDEGSALFCNDYDEDAKAEADSGFGNDEDDSGNEES